MGNPPGTLVQFEEARELVREQKLATKEKWQEWCDRACAPLLTISPEAGDAISLTSRQRMVECRCQEGKRPATVPSLPDRTYADEDWLSWADWLARNPAR